MVHGGARVAGGGGRCPYASCHGVVVVAGLRRGRRCRAELVQPRVLCFPAIERRWLHRDEGEEEAREWQLVQEDVGSGAGIAGVLVAVFRQAATTVGVVVTAGVGIGGCSMEMEGEKELRLGFWLFEGERERESDDVACFDW